MCASTDCGIYRFPALGVGSQNGIVNAVVAACDRVPQRVFFSVKCSGFVLESVPAPPYLTWDGRRRATTLFGCLGSALIRATLAANPLQMQPAPFLEAQEGGQGKTRGAMPRHINEAGLAMIKSFEGLRLDAYRDPVGIWTIGYGH